MLTIKHAKHSTEPDTGDAALIQPDDWNDPHTVEGEVENAMPAPMPARTIKGTKSGPADDLTADEINGILAKPTVITSGASHNVAPSEVRVLVSKTVSSPTGIVLPDSATKEGPVLIMDVKGDVATSPITVTFTGGQTAGGQTQVIIANPFSGYWFNPLPPNEFPAGGWYLTVA